MDRQACPPPEVLGAFVNGDLPDTELGRLADHLESCPACEQLIARLDGLADTMLMDLRQRIRHPSEILTSPRFDGPHVGPDRTECTATLPEQMEDFRIIREVGRGGMGIVYEAYQGSLNRHVALKMLPERGDLPRFQREARAAGRLHHTNIVPVFGVGEQDGRYFYVMQFIDGRGLDELLKDKGRRATVKDGAPTGCDYREVARIGVQAAEALAYAHAHGVIHRDVKPSNILLDERGTVWVTDFGLALDSTDTETLTHTGDLLGTLRYMAPERISGRGDARADIYGLGASLYELTCGRPAFADADRAVLMNQVLNHDPPRPRQLDPQVPRDLETIVLKAMARDPDQRYATADRLAEDLRRHLEDRPIRARRVSTAERAWRWSRRNPWLAGAIGSTAAALVVMAGLAILYANQKARLADQQTRIAVEQTMARVEIHGLNFELTRRGHDLEDSLAKANLNLAMLHFERGRMDCEKGEIGPGLLHLVECWRSGVAAGGLGAAWRHTARTSLSAWQRCLPELKAVFSHSESVTRVAFSPDGKTVMTGSWDGTVRLWNAATAQPLEPYMTHQARVSSAAFSPDGKTVITGSWDSKARLWDAATGRPTGTSFTHHNIVSSVAFSSDGKTVITGSWDHTARLWDAATGRPLGPSLTHQSPVTAVAFAPDGKTVITGSWDHTARLWDAATGRPLGPSLTHQGPVAAVAFAPDGKTVITASEDTTARLWDARKSQPIGPSLAHQTAVSAVMFSPDGKTVITGSWDKKAQLWDAATGQPLGLTLTHQGPVTAVAFSPDGKTVITGSDTTARLWDAKTKRITNRSLTHQGVVRGVAFSPDGKTVITGSADKTAQLWDAATGSPIGPALNHEGIVVSVAISPDSKTAMTGSWDGTVRLWDAKSGRPLPTTLTGQGQVVSTVFGPDARTVMSGSWDKPARLWDAATGRPLGPALAHPGNVFAVALGPDGRTVLTAGIDSTARFWDAPTGRSLGRTLLHQDSVLSLTFSPDGKTVLTGSADNTARLWDASTGQPLGPTLTHQGRVWAVAFSPDGKTVVTGSTDNTARLWDASTGQPLGPALTHQGLVWAVAFSPDGKTILTGSDDKTARLWEVDELPDELERVATWVEVLTGLEVDRQGQIHTLDAAAWRERRERLGRERGSPATSKQL